MLLVRRAFVVALIGALALVLPVGCFLVPFPMALSLRACIAVMILTFELMGVVAIARAR